MFQQRGLMFLYAISPVHMGAGQAIGVVDNPIQRERHTNHPVLAGSGIKGALRDLFQVKTGNDNQEDSQDTQKESLTSRIFGPPTDASDHAGAVSFADAQLVLFPVRSLRESYAYVTSPTALSRLYRLAQLCSLNLDWSVPTVKDDSYCLVGSAECRLLLKAAQQAVPEKIILETFEFRATVNDQVAKVASWLASQAIPGDDGFTYFREKLKKDLVVLSDTRFTHYVENATIVEPHVRISDESGTADDGGLFYTENVPPEALFVSLVLTSQERVKKGNQRPNRMTSFEVFQRLKGNLNNEVLQIGGDATTGRGLVTLRFVNRQEGGVS